MKSCCEPTETPPPSRLTALLGSAKSGLLLTLVLVAVAAALFGAIGGSAIPRDAHGDRTLSAARP